MYNYGEAIREQRLSRGLSLMDIEKRTGIRNGNLCRWENGQVLPNIDFCVQLAQFYGISVDELIGLSDYNADKSNLPAQAQTNLSEFDAEFKDILNDKNFIQTAKLFNAIAPELRALTFGYIVGLLQSQGVNTQQILKY